MTTLTSAQKSALLKACLRDGFWPRNGSQRSMAHRLADSGLLTPGGRRCPWFATNKGQALAAHLHLFTKGS